MKSANPYPAELQDETSGIKVTDIRHRVWEESRQAFIEDCKEHGIPVFMKDGVIVDFCEDSSTADSLLLDLEDFPELRA